MYWGCASYTRYSLICCILEMGKNWQLWTCDKSLIIFKKINICKLIQFQPKVYVLLSFQICSNKHIAHKWCSQPLLNRGLHSGDARISASLVATGNNFQKLALFASFWKLPFLSSSSFWKIQRTYVVPSIVEIWESHQSEVLDEFRGKDLVLLGD